MSDALAERVDIADVITRLTETGISADTIALSLDLPAGQVRALIRNRRHSAAPEEEQLQEAVRRLALRSVNKAMVLLDYGPMQVQQRIITSCLTGISKLLRNNDSGSTEEARQAFEELVAKLTDVQPKREVVTDTAIIEVPEVDVVRGGDAETT